MQGTADENVIALVMKKEKLWVRADGAQLFEAAVKSDNKSLRLKKKKKIPACWVTRTCVFHLHFLSILRDEGARKAKKQGLDKESNLQPNILPKIFKDEIVFLFLSFFLHCFPTVVSRDSGSNGLELD